MNLDNPSKFFGPQFTNFQQIFTETYFIPRDLPNDPDYLQWSGESKGLYSKGTIYETLEAVGLNSNLIMLRGQANLCNYEPQLSNP